MLCFRFEALLKGITIYFLSLGTAEMLYVGLTKNPPEYTSVKDTQLDQKVYS
jgi:hypothetical protein